jgi:myo-inositol-1(or 4)-monophosphatase
MAVSLPVQISRNSVEVQRFIEMIHACQSVRRLGSAALNLCYVAAGRLDGYVAGNLKAWDVAAGKLIIQEAGCQITNMRGKRLDLRNPKLAASATPSLHAEILEILAQLE